MNIYETMTHVLKDAWLSLKQLTFYPKYFASASNYLPDIRWNQLTMNSRLKGKIKDLKVYLNNIIN